jgi:hypothetical protein
VRITDETTGATVARLERNAWIGELTAPLGGGPLGRWDNVNEIELTLHSGHLASADDANVFAGSNRVVVEMDDGGWEVVGFAEAELVSPGTYRLKRLLRGQLGTDPAIGTAVIGSRVVVLDSRPTLIDVPATWLGDALALRAYAGASDATGTGFAADLGLEPLLPLRPAYLKAARDGSGDVTLHWGRRSRADTDSWAPAESPHDNLPEAYLVTILDGATPVREIAAASPSAIYTAAQQASDWGAPPDSFVFTVAQLSPVYGPGHAAQGTFDA